jgi:hypothetical protein
MDYPQIPYQEQGFSQQDYFPPMPQYNQQKETDSVGIIKELSPKKVLEQVRMNLKGFYYDYEEKKYVQIPGFVPLLYDKGIAKYLSILSSVITDLVTFSAYTKEEIPARTLYVCEKAIAVIHVNYKEYGIKEKSDLEILDVQIFALTDAAFKKALGGGDRGVIGKTTSENIMNRGDYPNQNKQGGGSFLTKINPFK